MSHHPVCGRVAKEYVGDPPPTQHLIGVKALAFPELMIEITALAVQ
jgi:enamine deaminase RidA (YjgF/YER057c/UK114 family)